MNFRAYAAELIATFTLTFIGAGAIIATKSEPSAGLITIALAHGLALSMAIYATSHISGGHVNPAVTGQCWSRNESSRRMPWAMSSHNLPGRPSRPCF